MTQCVENIKNNYSSDLNKCDKNLNNCNINCDKLSDTINGIKTIACKYNCDEKYKCDEQYKTELEILKDIKTLETIINKMNKNKVVFTDIRLISHIIEKNLNKNDKKYIKNKFSNKLSCDNRYNPCILNRKYLLHLILELCKKKYNKFNLNYYKIKNCHDDIGIPTNEDTYKFNKK